MQLRMDGLVPDNCVVVAFGWNIGRLFPRIVITDDVPVNALELRYLAGLDVMLAYHDRDASKVPDLVRKILKVNPRSLLAFHMGIPKNIILKNLAGEVFL